MIYFISRSIPSRNVILLLAFSLLIFGAFSVSTSQTAEAANFDPSGNVVDQFGDPIEGATVTLLRSDGDETGPFSVVPDGSFIMSPANRTNPDLTDAFGHFGWDVIAGFYKVTAEAEDCTSAETEVLTMERSQQSGGCLSPS